MTLRQDQQRGKTVLDGREFLALGTASPSDPSVVVPVDLTTLFAGNVSRTVPVGQNGSLGLNLLIEFWDSDEIEIVPEISSDEGKTWCVLGDVAEVEITGRNVMRPEVSPIRKSDWAEFVTVGAGENKLNVKLPPIDVPDVHLIRFRARHIGGGLLADKPKLAICSMGGRQR